MEIIRQNLKRETKKPERVFNRVFNFPPPDVFDELVAAYNDPSVTKIELGSKTSRVTLIIPPGFEYLERILTNLSRQFYVDLSDQLSTPTVIGLSYLGQDVGALNNTAKDPNTGLVTNYVSLNTNYFRNSKTLQSENGVLINDATGLVEEVPINALYYGLINTIRAMLDESEINVRLQAVLSVIKSAKIKNPELMEDYLVHLVNAISTAPWQSSNNAISVVFQDLFLKSASEQKFSTYDIESANYIETVKSYIKGEMEKDANFVDQVVSELNRGIESAITFYSDYFKDYATFNPNPLLQTSHKYLIEKVKDFFGLDLETALVETIDSNGQTVLILIFTKTNFVYTGVESLGINLSGYKVNRVITDPKDFPEFNQFGNSSDNVLLAQDKGNVVYARQGDDNVFGLKAYEAYGGPGDDNLTGSNGDDILRGGGGADNLNGGRGKDRLLGGRGPDYLVGGPGVDTLIGGQGVDQLIAGQGDIIKTKGPDEVFPSTGVDVINLEKGWQTVYFDRSFSSPNNTKPTKILGLGIGDVLVNNSNSKLTLNSRMGTLINSYGLIVAYIPGPVTPANFQGIEYI